MTQTVTFPVTETYTQWAASSSHSDVTIQNRGSESVEIVIAASVAGADDADFVVLDELFNMVIKKVRGAI